MKERHPCRRELIDVRRQVFRPAKAAGRIPVHVVGDDQQNIRPFDRRRKLRGGLLLNQRDQKQDGQNRSHRHPVLLAQSCHA